MTPKFNRVATTKTYNDLNEEDKKLMIETAYDNTEKMTRVEALATAINMLLVEATEGNDMDKAIKALVLSDILTEVLN